MATMIKFSQKDFRRGVDDALTLAPLRTAMKEAAAKYVSGRGMASGGKPTAKEKSEVVNGGNIARRNGK